LSECSSGGQLYFQQQKKLHMDPNVVLKWVKIQRSLRYWDMWDLLRHCNLPN
jgi:hypothetical protein